MALDINNLTEKDFPIKDYTLYRKSEGFNYKGKYIYNLFSNFVGGNIEVDGKIYASVESYYQSQKTKDESLSDYIGKLSPSHAKRQGRKLKLRDDWEDIKISVMHKGLKAKWSKSDNLKLLNTLELPIIEWNNWKDTTWGVDVRTNKGRNILGILLMKLRKELNT